MSNLLKTLSKTYDQEIRNKCEEKRLLLIDCLQEHFYDEFTCKILIKEFDKCVSDFDKDFRDKNKKYLKKFPYPNSY